MKPINYTSMQDVDYAKALGEVKTLADLRALTAEYGVLCEDAKAIADSMTETEFGEFQKGQKKERAGQFAGEEHANKYGAVAMPEVLFLTSITALQFHVPWGLAYIKMKEAKS